MDKVELREAIKQRPNEPQLYLNLGSLLLSKNKNEEEETAFQRAALVAPKDVRVLLAVSSVFGARG